MEELRERAGGPGPDPQAELWARIRSKVGPRHVIDACAPVVAFLGGYAAAGTLPGVIAALSVAAVLSVVRLTRGEGVKAAVLSFAAVGVAALLVHRTGRGEDFFLPDLAGNTTAVLLFVGTIVVRRPASGIALRAAGLEAPDWYRSPARRRAHTKVTAMWLALWCLHLAIEVPLYLSHQVVVLGVARLVFGPPMWLPVGWLSWRVLRAA